MPVAAVAGELDAGILDECEADAKPPTVVRASLRADAARGAGSPAKHSHGHRYLQGRDSLYRDEALGRVPRPRGCAVLGRGDQRRIAGGAAFADNNPEGSGCCRRRSSLGQHRQQSIPLPRRSLVREDQARWLLVRSASAGAGRQAGPRKGLHRVGPSTDPLPVGVRRVCDSNSSHGVRTSPPFDLGPLECRLIGIDPDIVDHINQSPMVGAPRRSAGTAIGNAGCTAPFPGAIARLADNPAATLGHDGRPTEPPFKSR